MIKQSLLFGAVLVNAVLARFGNPCSSKFGHCLESRTRDENETYSNPAAPFATFVQTLYDVAELYTQTNNERPANQLVMEYIRHESYNDVQWKTLIGGVDDDWVEYAESQGIQMMKTFIDPFFASQEVGAEHLFATMNGFFLKGSETPPGYNRGDVTGWLGDLFTFYGEWRRDDVDDGYDYCIDNLAESDVDSTFKLVDMIEDADGYNMAMILLGDSSLSIADVFAEYYVAGGGYATRFSDFFSTRFGTSTQATMDTACNGLTFGTDPVIAAGRAALITKTAGTVFVKQPEMLSDEELGRFCEGFMEVLTGLAATN